jgi:N-acylneuraminate cytidylyltransferase
VDAAIETLLGAQADSLFSACEQVAHVWIRSDEELRSVTYDWRERRREQEMPTQYHENGSIYVFRPELLRREGNRLGGRIAVHPMDYWSSFQLDTPEHAELLEWIMSHR